MTGRLIVFSGAGLSADSGLKTFRDAGGLWEQYPLDKVCNYRNWERNYDLVHEFYNMRRTQLAQVVPNAAHRLIAAWQQTYDTLVMTQNVDDLLERAGCTDVEHLHGFLPQMICEACEHVWTIGHNAWGVNDRCARCRLRYSVKPNVVFFHQPAPQYQRMHDMLDALRAEDVIMVTGTSDTVIPMSQMLARRPGYKIFNALEPPTHPIYDQQLLIPASAALANINAILAERLTPKQQG